MPPGYRGNPNGADCTTTATPIYPPAGQEANKSRARGDQRRCNSVMLQPHPFLLRGTASLEALRPPTAGWSPARDPVAVLGTQLEELAEQPRRLDAGRAPFAALSA